MTLKVAPSSKLLRIILIDSYFKGRRVEVDVSGHTNLSGTNAAGKTTFLKLVRIFFADAPGDVVKVRGKIRESFVNYYLPRLTSYIAFEYQTHSGIKQAVCFSKNESINYLFVDKPFELADYTAEPSLDGTLNLIPCTNIYRHFRLKQVPVKAVSSPSHYQKIILGTAVFSDKDLTEAKHRFSLAEPGKNLSMLNTVVGAALERNTDFKRIKELLSSIMLNGGKNELEFNMDVASLSIWKTDYNALRTYDDLASSMLPKLSKSLYTAENSETILAEYKHNLLAYTEQFNYSLKALTLELAALNTENSTANLKTSDEKNSLADQISDNNRMVDGAKRQIETIEAEKISWEEKDVGSLKSDYANIDHYQAQLDNASVEKANLLDEAQNITAKFDKLKSKRQAQFYSLKDQLSSQLSVANAEYSEITVKQNRVMSEAGYDLKTAISENENQLQQLSADYENKLSHCHFKLQSVDVSREARAQINLAQQELQRANEALNADSRQAIDFERQAQNSAMETDKILSEIADTANTIKTKVSAKNDLERLLNPQKNSLHEFLTNNVDDWSESIGKFLAPAVLASTHLNPDFSPEGSKNDFKGLTLDWARVYNDFAKTSDTISAEIEQIDQHILQLNETKEKLSGKVKAIANEQSTLQQDLIKIKAKIALKQQLLESINANINQLNIEQKNVIEQAKLVLETEAKALNNALSKLGRENKEKLSQINQQHLDRIRSLQEQHMGQNVELEGYIKQTEEKTSQNTTEYSLAISRLAADEKNQLNDKNIDTESLNKLDNEIVTLEKQLSRLKNAPGIISSYNAFMSNSYSQLDSLNDKSFKASQGVTNLTQSLTEFTDMIKARKAAFIINRDAITAKLSKVSQQHEMALRLTNRLGEFEQTFDTAQTHSFESICGELDNILKSHRKALKSIKGYAEQVISQMNIHLNSAIKKSIDMKSNALEIDPNLRLISDYIVKELPLVINEVRDLIIENAALRGMELSGFYDQLKRYESDINAFSLRVNSYLEKKTVFSALGKISINLTPLLESHEVFSALKSFKKTYEAWSKNNQQSLPPESYGVAMSEVLTKFTHNKLVERHSNLYDISFEAVVNNERKIARSGNDLKDISSNGMSYLILLAFTTSLGSMIKGTQDVDILYGVDELGEISVENVDSLFAMFDKEKDTIFTAIPNADNNFMGVYHKRYFINKPKNRFEQITANDDPLLKAISAAQTSAVGTTS
jgi:chromosome segregation ATPase